LDGIDKSHPFYVRILIYDDSDKRILASCERLSVYEAEEGALQSLLPVEPAPLGEQVWRISAGDGDRPILQVSDDPDMSMLERIRHDPYVQALVLPEAVRRALEHLLRYPAEDDEEDDSWQSRWARYLDGLGLAVPSEHSEDEGDPARLESQWIDEAVRQISANLKFRSKALASLSRTDE
jgi:hypothetical protein